ncbi:MAG: ABC transporter permease [Defluviitaleaceae bacterium]|nr:ABC transporter permease [Defluviitaleaceae bacterium]
MTIFLHYLKRHAREPIGIAIYIIAPIVFLFFTTVINEAAFDAGIEAANELPGVIGEVAGAAAEAVVNAFQLEGGSLNTSINAFMSMIMFQLMGSLIVIDVLFRDLRKDMRWRLAAAPVKQIKLVVGNFKGAFIFAMVSGLLIILFNVLLGGYMFTPWVVFATLILVALMSQLLGVLMFFLFNRMAVANTVAVIFVWSMALIQGLMFQVPLPDAVERFGQYHTPLAWAMRAIMSSGGTEAQEVLGAFNVLGISFAGEMSDTLRNMGFLAAFVAVLAVAVVIASHIRGRKLS